MKTIVITGSTRGIGLGLARCFLERGCQVVVTGRSSTSVNNALEQLADFPADKMLGQPCDVTSLEQVQALWDAAVERFGRVDIWVNNAGLSHDSHNIWELPSEVAKAVIDINVHGVLHGSSVAIKGMHAQGGGHLYNMDGFGSKGRMRTGLSVYGTSKRAVHYMTRALAKELEGSVVKASHLSPGMVLTDMLLGSYAGDPDSLARAKRIFNILADKVETVTPWLTDQMLANDKNGAEIAWLTGPKIGWRFLMAPFNKRDLFA